MRALRDVPPSSVTGSQHLLAYITKNAVPANLFEFSHLSETKKSRNLPLVNESVEHEQVKINNNKQMNNKQWVMKNSIN